MKDNKKDYSAGDMERIQKGLEEFLQQEMNRPEPQLYDLREDVVAWESDEIPDDRAESADWDEEDTENWGDEEIMADWDSKESRRQEKEARKQSRQNRRSDGSGQMSGSRTSAQTQNGKKRAAQPETTKAQPAKKTKKRRKKSGFKRFLTMLLVLVLLVAGGAYVLIGNVYNKMHYEAIASVETQPMKEEGVINILLIGNDSRTNGEDGRSDAMILLSINNSTKKIYMTSLLRDMYVEIPGYKGNRLNAAYAYGGAELLMETIEQNFDISVNRYMLVNFEAFANLVDAVGGVDLELSKEEVEYVNAYLWEYNILTGKPEGTDYMDTSLSGVIHLNGPQALAYTRNRYLGTDFGRTERQRKVLAAIIDKAPKALLTNSGELIDGLMPNLTTNLTKNECYRLSLTAAQALGYEIIQGSIPLEGTYKNATIRDMSVLEVDFAANKQYLQDVVYGKAE